MRCPIVFLFFVFVLSLKSFAYTHFQVGYCKEFTSVGGDTNYTIEVTSFDSLGKVIYFETDWYQFPVGNNWNRVRTSYAYDSLDRIISESHSSYTNSNVWNYGQRRLYLYGPNGKLSQEILQMYNGAAYDNQQQFLYSYNANGDMILREEQNWVSGVWINDTRVSINYDSLHNILDQYNIVWQTSVFDTIVHINFVYQYNAGLVTSAIRTNITYSSTDSTRMVFYYDQLNRDSIVYTFNCPTPSCIDSLGRTEYHYTNNSDTLLLNYSKLSGTWTLNERWENQFNSFGSNIHQSHYYSHGGGGITDWTYDFNNLIVSRNREWWAYLHPTNFNRCNYNHIYNDSLNVQPLFIDSVCQGDSSVIFVSITGGTLPYTVTWQDNPSILGAIRWVKPDSTSFYYYTVTDSLGQTYSDSVEVIVPVLPSDTVVILGAVDICPGNAITLSYNYPVISGRLWKQGNVYGYADQFTIQDTGRVFLTLYSSAGGCLMPLNTSVYIGLQQPHPDLGNDTTVCMNHSLVLDPGQFVTYNWNSGNVSPVDTVSSSIPGTFTYYVSVTDSNNCMSNSDTINVTYDICAGIVSSGIESISVFPNPVNDFVRIPDLNKSYEAYSIYNVDRALIETGPLTEVIDVRELAPGIYFLQFRSKTDLATVRILKY